MNISRENKYLIQHFWCRNRTISGEIGQYPLQWRHTKLTGAAIVYSTVCSGVDKIHQSSVSLAFVRGIHRWPVNSPHKGTITRTMFPFGDVTIIVTDAPALCVTRSSVATVLTIYDKRFPIFHEHGEGFKLAPTRCWEMIENENIVSRFSNRCWATKVKSLGNSNMGTLLLTRIDFNPIMDT